MDAARRLDRLAAEAAAGRIKRASVRTQARMGTRRWEAIREENTLSGRAER
jgi:hypothetical protein